METPSSPEYESWLQEVVDGHKEHMSNPDKGVPADMILSRIKLRRAQQKNKE